MKITTAKSAGFCFGVKRAVDTVYEQIGNGTKVYTYGPIIHNQQVINDLAEKGVVIINSEDELKLIKEGVIIIRSHGVSRSIFEAIKERGVEVIDATCPFVKKIHDVVAKESVVGSHIVIIGNRDHPEVCGIKGWCKEMVTIIENKAEASAFRIKSNQKICIVAQTTFNYNKFQELVELLGEKGYDRIVVNTICNATEERQTEAKSIAKEVDTMIVVGDRNSSNTQKLYEICKDECENTYHVEIPVDLKTKPFQSFNHVGITAGASTPNIIIEEVQKRMSEMSFEQMLEETFKTIRNGEIVEGTVIDVKPDEAILNIGYKADGILSKNEYTNEPNFDLTTALNMGDVIDVKVLKVNDGEGQVLLTYKRLLAEKGNKKLEDAFESQEVLKAKVAQVLNGGLSVVVDEARVFIPASLVSDMYEKDLSKYADQEIEFVISEFNPKKRRIIGNRKQLLMADRAERQKELLSKIAEGDKVDGIIKNVTDFGAFVDLGGADGLLHISEMSWGRVESPKKVFKAGDSINVLIKEINNDKIALSLKFDTENPWITAADKYAVGNVVSGKVARMTDFGAFVELEPGVDALLHVSQISREHVEKPSDILSVGQVVEAKVVDFNGEDRKISLSMKALEPELEEAEEVATEEFVDAPVEEAVAETTVEEVAEEIAEPVEEAIDEVMDEDEAIEAEA